MTSIQVAFHSANADLAHSIQANLGRIGIPFEFINQNDGVFSSRVGQSEEPVLLLVTDNLLKDFDTLNGLLTSVLSLREKNLIFPVVADGKNADNTIRPTHIDRMVNALHYMNFWQNEWLAVSSKVQHASGAEKTTLDQELDAKRAVANDIGDLISNLRDAGAVEWPSFTANDYAWFFSQLGLEQWHDAYKNAVSDATQPAETATPHQGVSTLNMAVLDGSLAPAPIDLSNTQSIDFEPDDTSFSAMNDLLEEIKLNPEEVLAMSPDPETELLGNPAWIDPSDDSYALQDNLISEPALLPDADVKAMIRDAWFWINQGHSNQGLELLDLAIEQYPDHTELRSESERAHNQVANQLAKIKTPESPTIVQTERPASGDEAQSYDLMGDMAADKGDYLFAKYCWDRAAELDPEFPNIYRKLGLLTNEHLRDYKETAAIYLHKALEIKPNDSAVLIALAEWDLDHQQRDLAAQRYIRAIELSPELRKPDLDALFLPQQKTNRLIDIPELSTTAHDAAAQVGLAKPEESQAKVLTVLITGASSGIGRATAEIFAHNGHRLMITGRRAERLSELKSKLERKYNTDVLMLPFDIRDQITVQGIFEGLPESWQCIDILVNNAGLAKGLAPIHEGNLEHWETMIDTNIKGLLYITRVVAPGMVRRKRGHIINIGSSAGKEVYLNGNVYCATKFAVDALTRAMRMDLFTHNIRVSQVSPGHVEETEFAVTRFDGDKERAKIYQDFQPLRSSDVAEVIYFMATRPSHVNIQDVQMFSTQQASSTMIDRTGRG